MITITIIVQLLLFQTVISLKEFITKQFSQEIIVIVSSSFSNLDTKLNFIFQLNQSKLIITSQNVSNLESFNNYLIIEQNLTSLSPCIDSMKSSVNTRGKFLVVVQENTTEDETKLVLETLWRFYIYNVVIYTNWSIFVTWYPYHPDNHCGTTINLVESQTPYDNKIPTHLNSCPIRASWVEMPLVIKTPFSKRDPGYGIRVIDTVAEKINLSVIYLKTEMGSPHTDADLFLTLSDNQKPVGTEFELSTHYTEINCYFVLPPRRKITSSTSTLVVFSTDIWMMMFVSILSMIILWKHLTKGSLQTCFFQIVRLILQGILRQIPDGTLARVVSALFFFYILPLSWIYVSQLSGVLSQPSYEPKISTIQEFAESTKRLKIDDTWEKFLKTKGVYTQIVKKQIKSNKTNSFDEDVNQFIQNLDYAIILSDTRLLFFKNYEKLEVLSQDKVRPINLYWESL